MNSEMQKHFFSREQTEAGAGEWGSGREGATEADTWM